jgi:hypothetical protein
MGDEQSETERATEYLNKLLREAVEAGADTVELERVPEGLEVCVLVAGSGIGTVLKSRALEEALIQLVVRRARLENRASGKLDWNVLGANRRITVEEYDSFGESCFRLRLDRAKPSSKKT